MQAHRMARIASFVVAAVLLLMGAMKFMNPEVTRTEFIHWGYPAWFGFVVGAGEVAAAVLLAVRRTTRYGAALGAVLMTGAIVTHLRVPEVGLLPLAIPLLALSGFVLWQNRQGAPAASAAPA